MSHSPALIILQACLRVLEVYAPYLNLVQARFRIFLDIDIDGEMCIDISHFVLETPSNANDQVIDESLDGPKSSHVLARAMMQLDIDNLF